MNDFFGRKYAKLSELKPGMFVQVDCDFDCIEAWATREVKCSPDFELYIDCESGQHLLEGQLDFEGDNDSLIGIYKFDNDNRRVRLLRSTDGGAAS